MDNPFFSGPPSGEAMQIVQVLRQFGRSEPVPIDLVARVVGRDPSQIRESLCALQEKQVLKVEEEKGVVSLTV